WRRGSKVNSIEAPSLAQRGVGLDMSDTRGRLETNVARQLEARLGSVTVGGGRPVIVMGALTVSPESFYGGSVHRDQTALLRAATAMVNAGAAMLDVGARSTAPYLDTAISDDEETERLARAVELLVTKLGVPVSADTARSAPARAALDAGATIVNDVTALRSPDVARLVAERGVSLIMMASPSGGPASE